MKIAKACENKSQLLTACATPQKKCAVLEELPARSTSADELSWK